MGDALNKDHIAKRDRVKELLRKKDDNLMLTYWRFNERESGTSDYIRLRIEDLKKPTN